jgi:hypothetical protein
MALVDLIATGKEAEQLITDNGNLQNQLSTAALQHGNDQQAIAVASATINSLKQSIADDTAHIDDITARLSKVIADYNLLNSTVTYPDLEWAQFALNLKPDAASVVVGLRRSRLPIRASLRCSRLHRMLLWLATRTTTSTCMRLASSSRTLRIGTLHFAASGTFRPILT